MSATEMILYVMLTLFRACVGGVMIYSGVELLRGDGLLSGSQFDSNMTGIFVIVLGLYCVFADVLRKFTEYMDRRQ